MDFFAAVPALGARKILGIAMPENLAGIDTQLIVLVAASLLIAALLGIAVLLVRRLRNNRLQVTALDHELFVHEQSADRKIGEFSGFAHAVAFADRQNGRGPKRRCIS